MPNGHLEKIEISKRVIIVFVQIITQVYASDPEKLYVFYLKEMKRKIRFSFAFRSFFRNFAIKMAKLTPSRQKKE